MNAECKSARQQIDAADRGWQPDNLTQAHLASCASCKTFHEQELKLRELVGGLGTVAAPPDFDFRLRARLASDKSVTRSIGFGGFSFGLRSAALATLVLVLAAAFIYRGINNGPATPHVAKNPLEIVEKPLDHSAKETAQTPTDNGTRFPVNSDVPSSVRKPVKSNRSRFQQRQAVATDRKTVSRDFSSATAEVVPKISSSHPDSVFPIDTPSESLKVSLDDSNGVSRTISLPRVSFGSQRFVGTETSTAIKTNAKGVW